MKPALVALAAALLVLAPVVAAASWSISIAGFAYSPSALAADAGDVVTWTNRDSATHTVTCDVGSCGFGSPSLFSGTTFTTTLAGAGTQSYHCSIHLGMKGKLFVGSGLLAADADLAPDASTLAGSRPLIGGLVPDPRAAHVSVTVRNEGAASSAPTTVEFHTTDATGADVRIGTATLPAIPPGGAATVGVDWPNAPLTGNAPARALVDPTNLAVEAFETNNEARGTVRVGLV